MHIHSDRARVLLAAALRYTRSLSSTRPSKDDGIADVAGVLDVWGVWEATHGNVDLAARYWLNAADAVSQPSADPDIISIRASIGRNLQRVSRESDIAPDLAASCVEWAEWLARA